jgi:hypothetical protein
VTLNITVLVPNVIYQSTDLLLFDTATRKPYSEPSTKTVTLTYPGWTGFVTYTGLGRARGQDTSAVVRSWFEGRSELSFDEAVELIRTRGSNWLNAVCWGGERSFVVAGFVDSVATAAVISNFEKWHGRREASISGELFVSTVTAQTKTEVIVTGQRGAVSRPQRRAIVRRAQDPAVDSSKIRRVLAETNRRAARLRPELISEDCFVYSQDLHGRGHEEAFGSSRVTPSSVTAGVDLEPVIRSLLDDQFGAEKWTLKSAALGSSRDRSEAPVPCSPRLSTVPTEERYRAVLLATPQGRRAIPRGIGPAGIIVGEGTPKWRGPSYPTVWHGSDHLSFVRHLGGLGGSVLAVAASGMAVGASETPKRTSHACLWTPEGELQDLGASLVSHSGARAINSKAAIAGWASVHPTESGQAHFRPVIWSETSSPRLVEDLGGRWGEGVDVDEAGNMLILVNDGREAGAWILPRDESPFDAGKPSSTCRSFFPLRIRYDGAVLGVTIGVDGRRGAAARLPEGSWEEVALPQSAELTAVSDRGDLAGYADVDDYRAAWIWPSGAESWIPLPRFADHHHHPTAVMADGTVVGTAGADDCSHPVLWQPVRNEVSQPRETAPPG